MSSFRQALVSIALAALASAAGARGAAQQPQTLAGTYRIAICRGPCEPDDTTHALAWGVLVLAHAPIDPHGLPDYTHEIAAEGREPYNACFSLVQARHAGTLAGVEPAALTRWEKGRGGPVRLLLVRSPDSGYEAALRPTPDGLRGRGHSWGIDMGPVQLPDDSLAARRTGPPDPSVCVPSPTALARIAAGLAEADSIRGDRRPADPNPETAAAPPFASVAAGGSQSCALTPDGRAYCWGANTYGMLGDGTRTDRLAAVPVAGSLRFSALSVGPLGTCGISGGRAWCWGSSRDGELGADSAPDRCFEWACSLRPVPVDGGLRLRAISVGRGHACALADDGRAYCWGDNSYGALGARTPGEQKTPVAVSGGLRFASISAGERFTCALTAEGVAYCWGDDQLGQLGDGGAAPRECAAHSVACRRAPVPVAGGLHFRAVAAGGEGACGITRAGHAYCWGAGARSLPDDPDDLSPPAYRPVRVPGAVRFASILPPQIERAVCGLDAHGRAWCWGRRGGVFVSHARGPRPAPVPLAAGHTFRALAGGLEHACGLEAGGAVFCWGSNQYGELGNGHTSDFTPPSRVLLRK
ncbi:MAG: RCC1 domain-containing protein [Longimicrobiaceae bacterium]